MNEFELEYYKKQIDNSKKSNFQTLNSDINLYKYHPCYKYQLKDRHKYEYNCLYDYLLI